jgi:hypothetical protein
MTLVLCVQILQECQGPVILKEFWNTKILTKLNSKSNKPYNCKAMDKTKMI